jgi:Ca-activated chloride channel family protein
MRIVLAAIIASLVLVVAPAAQQQPTFRSGTLTVPLYVTVTDNSGRLVPDLDKEDFEIFEDQKPRPVDLFQDEALPITIVVMLDTSGSMTLSVDEVKNGAEQFLIRLLPQDKGMVGAFNDKIQFTGPFTSDRDDLVGSLKDLDFGYPTRLYDAIDASMNELQNIDGRRVVIVFTDGEDTASKLSEGTVVDRARREGVMIYGIGLESEYFNGQQRVRSKPDRVLRKLAEDTGGGYFELKRTADLNTTFTRVAQELHSQYVLGFSPATLDGKVHKLDVRVKRTGMTARTRKTYVATAQQTSTTR